MTLKRTLKVLLSTTALSAVFSLSAPAFAEPSSAAGCQKIQSKIDFYTNLRQSGGTSAQITDWSAAQYKYRALYVHYQCDQYTDQLL